MEILMIIIGYLISAAIAWYYINIFYSKDGKGYPLHPSLFDLFIVIIPAINSLMILLWVIYPPKEKAYNLSKFFKIKDNK